MKQVTKFYLTSFFKNQTYFTPILIFFLKFNHLNYKEIFWVFTIASVFSLIIEIPTGIFADLYGKKKSIIISKFGIFVSYVLFGFSSTFWMFLLSQIVYELGNSFRTGTENRAHPPDTRAPGCHRLPRGGGCRLRRAFTLPRAPVPARPPAGA